MNKLATLIILQIMAMNIMAQNYIKRTAEEPVYDVEVIVFSHALSQPPAEFIQQAQVYAQDDSVEVKPLPEDEKEDWPIIKTPPVEKQIENPQQNATENQDNSSREIPEETDNWQVPLDEEPIDYEVLVWYLKSNQLNSAVVDRLMDNPKYLPLIRQVWRQPTTPFTEPLYVQVNSESPDSDKLDIDSANETESQVLNSDESLLQKTTAEDDFILDGVLNNEDAVSDRNPINTIKDHQINGQVALSEGRFTHLHIKFNYYRINNEEDVLIYASKQQRQIKPNEWQYFDHNQFGVLVKVTAIKAEELL